MSTVSYADNWEDVLLARAFARGHQGFYVDVGATDPEAGSVTKLFYDLGWSGTNVQADPERFERLRAARPRDVNLTEVTTLAAICETHARPDIDFLVVGMPGQEREFLDGGDWQRWRPRIVLVKVDRQGAPDGHETWEKVLLDADYAFAVFNGLTRFYVRGEDRDLLAALATPVNAFDDFVPAAHAHRLRELEDEREALRRDLAAARAVNETMRALYVGVQEVDALRAQTTSLEAAAASIQSQCEETRALMADALSRYEQLRRDVVQTRIEVEAAQSVFRSVGPAGMAVAQKLAQASLRFPAAGTVAKRSARMGKWVKRALRSAR